MEGKNLSWEVGDNQFVWIKLTVTYIETLDIGRSNFH